MEKVYGIVNQKKLCKSCILFAAVLLGIVFQTVRTQLTAYAQSSDYFEGNGTQDSPYLISSKDGLKAFRNTVNQGQNYKGVYFQQTSDIDLSGEEWVPVGEYGTGNYFYGVYDGNGRTIYNLSIHSCYGNEKDNAGLFGQLGGVVVNLRVVDADISGNCVGIITSHGTNDGSDSAIINCYTSGTLHGYRASGIADHFFGTIANCISDVTFDCKENSEMFGVLSYMGNCKVYNCASTALKIANQTERNKTANTVEKTALNSRWFVHGWNWKTALTQVLFGDHFGVSLKQVEASENAGEMVRFSDNRRIVSAVHIVNKWFLTVLLIVMTVAAARGLILKGIQNAWTLYRSKIIAAAIITSVVSVFVDCAAVGAATEYLNLSNLLFLLLINGWCIVSLVLVIRNLPGSFIKKCCNVPLAICLLSIFVLEIIQFGMTPRYDGHLYYGSLVKGISNFRMDPLTFLSAFNTWKCACGSALLIAPLEFLATGQVFGVYVANVFITAATVVVFFLLLKETFENISDLLAALFCLLFVACPYQLGMFTYLCYDNYLSYYAVWLMYAYKKRNDLLISFIGFLMTFSKITGLAFYCLFLIAATTARLLNPHISIVKNNLRNWWKTTNVFLWVLPGLLYLPLLNWSSYFRIEYVIGMGGGTYGSKNLVDILNTVFQTFVFGFRWLFVLVLLVLLAVFLFQKKKLTTRPHRATSEISFGLAASGVGVFSVLLIYHGVVESPRYTAIFNIVYIWMLAFLVNRSIPRARIKSVIISLLTVLLSVQSFYTIDPSLILHNKGLYTGAMEIKQLDFEGKYDLYWGCEYTYNIQGNFYDRLISMFLKTVNNPERYNFCVLDTNDYEMHLHGMQYPMYWNTRLKRMTYDGKDKDSVFLKGSPVSTELVELYKTEQFGNEFYLIVPARINEHEMLAGLQRKGYRLAEETEYRDRNGAIRVYRLSIVE